MKLDLRTSLGTFVEQSRISKVRNYLVAKCGHCNHGRRIEPSILIELFGPDASFKMTPYSRNARTHSKKQIRQIADSIKQNGFTKSILIDENCLIMAGHERLTAAILIR